MISTLERTATEERFQTFPYPPPPIILSARLPSCLLNRASPVAQMVKSLPAMQEALFQSLGWEDPLEEEMATHSSISCLKNSIDRGAWQGTVHRVAKSQTGLSDFLFGHN